MKKLLLLCGTLIALATSWTLAQGLSSGGWGNAQWIWDEADAHRNVQSNEPRYLRLTFTLEAKPITAEVWVTADNHYVAHVNGQKVGEDSEWATVEKYDVAKYLVAGKNVVAIKATNQGGVAGAIARLHIKTADKKDQFIVTDEKTKIRRAGNVSDGWQQKDFDDTTWFAAIVLGDTSIGPWNLGGGATVAQGGKKKKAGVVKGYDTSEVAPVKGRLSAQEQQKLFVVPKDFEIELVAADPLIINPITMVMDDKGRIIVSESHTYRYGPPGSPIKPYANPVIRLDPDGKGGFTRTLIADGFADPVMGIAVKGDKLWLAANNYLYTYDLPETSRARKEAGLFLPSPPGRGAGGEGAGQKATGEKKSATESKTPSPPTPLPGGEGSKTTLLPGGEGSKPLATNKETIVTDLNKAWNPFGMFVLEWGPDGKLYMSVGNHAINLQGPDKDKMSGRGSSGIVVRMDPDGSKMERLVHGLRVPYSFEMDPFGQLWVLSNGEGNPNRLVRVLDGVDYHCYSRGAVDNNWLAGNHPLAPPSEELHRGAHTQLMRYYAAAYPQEYQGNLFLCNWGAHGYAGPNRAINRFVLDDRNNVVQREPLVWCKDPHFRPAHIMYDQDGSLLIADWYGRDDESDLTGRIWRLKYVGKNAPVVKHKLDSAEWKNDDYAISALGSPSHLVREKAIANLINRGKVNDSLLLGLAVASRKSEVPLQAVNALWTLLRIDLAESKALIVYGAGHSDWKVRSLALQLMRRHQLSHPSVKGLQLTEKDSAVRLAAALASSEPTHAALTGLLNTGTANDVHLRYEAAWHLAKHADEKAITTLLTSDDANVRLAGLIAIDVACYENFPTRKAALEALAKVIEDPGKLDHQLMLDVARLNGDATIVPALEKLIAREDVPTATVARAFLVLKAKAGPAYALKAQGAGKRFIEAVEKGQLKIATPADQLVVFEFLESEGATPFALKQIDGQLRSTNKELRLAAHTLARRFGPKADSLAGGLWPSVLNPKTKFEEAIESLSTIARVEAAPKKDAWLKLLDHEDQLIRTEGVRWWRRFKGQREMVKVLSQKTGALISKDGRICEDLVSVLNELEVPLEDLKLEPRDKESLTRYALKEVMQMPVADRSKRAAMGMQVFERNACTTCHTTATQTTKFAPSLKGIAGQKPEYLVESILYPSKVIKTGFEAETIELKNGKTLTGLVHDDGKNLRFIDRNENREQLIAKNEVETRRVSKISFMPEGQEALLSRRELVDLIAFLQTLK